MESLTVVLIILSMLGFLLFVGICAVVYIYLQNLKIARDVQKAFTESTKDIFKKSF